MGLSKVFARIAVRATRVLVVEVAGHWSTRVALEHQMGRRGWRPARTPAEADVLAVCGTPGDEMTPLVERLWDHMPGPRVRIALPTGGCAGAALDEAETSLLDTSHHAADAAVRLQMSEIGNDAQDHETSQSSHEGMGHGGHGAAHDHTAVMDHGGNEPHAADHDSHADHGHMNHGVGHNSDEIRDHASQDLTGSGYSTSAEHADHESMDHPGDPEHSNAGHSHHRNQQVKHPGEAGSQQDHHAASGHGGHSHHEGMKRRAMHESDEHDDHEAMGHTGHDRHGHDATTDHAMGHVGEETVSGADDADDTTTGHAGHASHAGMDHAGHGGHDHGDMDMAPAGIALAEGGTDRDGLEMDVLHLPLGPVLPYWPAGLVLNCSLQGDVVVEATASMIDRDDEEILIGASGTVLSAAVRCDHAAVLLELAGADDAAATARIARDAAVSGDWNRAQKSLTRLNRIVRRSVVLRWALRRVFPLTAADLERHDLPGWVLGDAYDRLLLLVDQAAAGIDGEETPDGVPLSLETVPDLIGGLEVATVRLAIASLAVSPLPSVSGAGHD